MIIKSLGPRSPAKALKPVWPVASLCKMRYMPPVGPAPPSSTVAGAESLSGWDYASQGGSQLTTSWSKGLKDADREIFSLGGAHVNQETVAPAWME